MIGYKKVNMKNITLDGVEYTPVIKPKTELPTTVQGVYDEVKPEWLVDSDGWVHEMGYNENDLAQLPTKALAEKALAYIQLLTVCHWANERFEGDGEKWVVDRLGGIRITVGYGTLPCVWHTTSRAAVEYIREHHLELVKKFYGIV